MNLTCYNEFRESFIQEQRRTNLNAFYQRLISDSLTKEDKLKIQNHYLKYKIVFQEDNILSLEDLLIFLKTNKSNCRGLEIDPTKQSIDEKLQINFINYKYQKNIQKLPGRGKKALCFDKSGKITSPDILQYTLGERSKTFDAIEIIGSKEIYYSNKFTNETGGAQDNQIKDVESFLDNAFCFVINSKEDKEFGVILSGKIMEIYYRKFTDKYNHPKIHIYYL